MAATKYEQRLSSTGRNDTCPCGSGKKYKKCHLLKDEESHNKAVAKAREAAARAAAEQEPEEGKGGGAPAPEFKDHKHAPKVPKPKPTPGARQVSTPGRSEHPDIPPHRCGAAESLMPAIP
jgi:preprotein translocase subunit SecA